MEINSHTQFGVKTFDKPTVLLDLTPKGIDWMEVALLVLYMACATTFLYSLGI